MDTNALLFFQARPDAAAIYEALESRILREISNVEIRVQKTQISFYNRHLFACASFARLRPKKDCPPAYIVVSFGLGHRLLSPRIEAAVEPYPGRWTHHVLLSDPEQADDELMGWLQEAARFSDAK